MSVGAAVMKGLSFLERVGLTGVTVGECWKLLTCHSCSFVTWMEARGVYFGAKPGAVMPFESVVGYILVLPRYSLCYHSLADAPKRSSFQLRRQTGMSEGSILGQHLLRWEGAREGWAILSLGSLKKMLYRGTRDA